MYDTADPLFVAGQYLASASIGLGGTTYLATGDIACFLAAAVGGLAGLRMMIAARRK